MSASPRFDDDLIADIVDRVRRRFSMKPKVAIAGFGNSGKSSLFNAIYGGKVASVSMKTDETAFPDTKERFGIDFTDTPGFGTEKFSLDSVATMLDGQHVVVHVLNATSAISEEDARLNRNLAKSRATRVTVVNKVDLLEADEQGDVITSVREKLGLAPDAFLFVSAKKGTNVPTLVQKITELLPGAMQDAFVAQQQADMELKAKRINTLIYAKATIAAGVGAIPIPVADIIILTPLQVGMVAAIGYFHGIEVSKERAMEFMGVVAAGVGLREAARQLVKFIPGWGSVVSAAIAFAGTVALGKAADAWFKSNMKMPAEELQEVFKRAAAEAKKEYGTQGQKPVSPEVAALNEQRMAGKLTEEQLMTSLAKLDGEA